ncbi:class I SAM-dependent methyltransferase [Cystobacter fuscus]|nr:class I SAM-dependent methyltransferase [Cystobacter fuscus]
MLQRLGSVEQMDVLDFGCGSGLYSRLLKKRGARRVVGYDEAEGMLRYASRREEKERRGIEYTSRLADRLEGQFDVVLGVYVLHYASTREGLHAMCASMSRLLRPGGRLLTLPIHPAYEGDPEYYRPYGLRLVSDRPHEEGGAVQLELSYDHFEASVTAWYWSAAALETALRAAGFGSIQWLDPMPPGLTDVEEAPEPLRPYLRKPHTVLIDCRKE